MQLYWVLAYTRQYIVPYLLSKIWGTNYILPPLSPILSVLELSTILAPLMKQISASITLLDGRSRKQDSSRYRAEEVRFLDKLLYLYPHLGCVQALFMYRNRHQMILTDWLLQCDICLQNLLLHPYVNRTRYGHPSNSNANNSFLVPPDCLWDHYAWSIQNQY